MIEQPARPYYMGRTLTVVSRDIVLLSLLLLSYCSDESLDKGQVSVCVRALVSVVLCGQTPPKANTAVSN